MNVHLLMINKQFNTIKIFINLSIIENLYLLYKMIIKITIKMKPTSFFYVKFQYNFCIIYYILGSSALIPGAVFLRFFTVAFLPFLTPVRGPSPSGLSV